MLQCITTLCCVTLYHHPVLCYSVSPPCVVLQCITTLCCVTLYHHPVLCYTVSPPCVVLQCITTLCCVTLYHHPVLCYTVSPPCVVLQCITTLCCVTLYHHPALCFSQKEVELSVNDWLDGIQKTVRSSIQEAKDRESQGKSPRANVRVLHLKVCVLG